MNRFDRALKKPSSRLSLPVESPVESNGFARSLVLIPEQSFPRLRQSEPQVYHKVQLNVQHNDYPVDSRRSISFSLNPLVRGTLVGVESI